MRKIYETPDSYEVEDDGLLVLRFSKTNNQIPQEGKSPQEIVDEMLAAGAEPAKRLVEVTMRQARLALLTAGKLDAVDAIIATLPGDAGKAARIEWEYSGTVRSDSPIVEALKALLPMTEAEVDALFVSAKSFI